MKEKLKTKEHEYFEKKRGKTGPESETPAAASLYQEIKDLQDQIKYLAEEKIVAVKQAEREIQAYLIQLDDHIRRFQIEYPPEQTEEKPLIKDESLNEPMKIDLPKKRKNANRSEKSESIIIKKKAKPLEDSSFSKKFKAKPSPSKGTIVVETNQGGPYCFCQKNEPGDMIGCDNPNCRYKWFHFGCVGITAAPAEGEIWYCPECEPNMLKRHK